MLPLPKKKFSKFDPSDAKTDGTSVIVCRLKQFICDWCKTDVKPNGNVKKWIRVCIVTLPYLLMIYLKQPKCFSFWGLHPWTSYQGLAPEPHWGTYFHLSEPFTSSIFGYSPVLIPVKAWCLLRPTEWNSEDVLVLQPLLIYESISETAFRILHEIRERKNI